MYHQWEIEMHKLITSLFWLSSLSSEAIRVRLHQAVSPTQSQRCDDACDTALSENNGVTLKWVATSFWSDYLFPVISMGAMSQASSQHWLCIDAITWCKPALSELNPISNNRKWTKSCKTWKVWNSLEKYREYRVVKLRSISIRNSIMSLC